MTVSTVKKLVAVPIGRQFQYLFRYNKNIEYLEYLLARLIRSRDEVEMKAYETHRNAGMISDQVRDWLERVDDIERRSEEILGNDVPVDVNCLKWKCPNLKIRYLLSRKATRMALVVEALVVEDLHDHIPRTLPPERSSEVPESKSRSFPSRSSIADKIMDALNSNEVNVIGICGIRGIGKTAVAEEVARRARSQENFDDVVMTVVLQNTDLIEIQNQLAVMLGLQIRMKDIHTRAQCLRVRLTRGTKTLVIVDDVREAIDLDKLGIPDTNCKVVLTSRLESTCNKMGAKSNFAVNVLSNQEAWDLFKDTFGESVEDDDLPEIAEDIAQACRGIPLEIVTTGKALIDGHMRDWDDALARLTNSTSKVPSKGNKPSLGDALQPLRKSAKTNISQSQREAYSKIESCYNDLTSAEAKSLFLLCCQFPEDGFISIEMLVRYGQGLQGFETLKSARDIVYKLVKDLKGCRLLLDAGESSVKVQDIERQVGRSIAAKDGNEMCVVRRGSELKECRRNDNYKPYTTRSLHSNKMHELPTSLDLAKVNLLWLAYSHEEIEISDDFFEGMEKLKVIHVSANFVKPLPLSLKFLTNLQTLCLDFCRFRVDISFIGDLKKLKILSFFHSDLEVLPSKIRELTELKLLDLRCHLGPSIIPSGVLSSLKKLEELYTGQYFDVGNVEKRNSANVKELNLLSQLKVLQISMDLDDEILLKLKRFRFDNLEGFDFSTFERKSLPFPQHQFSKTAALDRVDMSVVLMTNVKELMQRVEKLSLRGLKKLKDSVIGLDKEVFANLKRLRISSCHGVERVVDNAICNLESLEIVEMLELTEIYSDNLPVGSFERLQELSLNELPMMMYLWKGHVERPSFGNLRILTMHDCGAIKSLFPRSVVKCLVELQELMITKCGKLKEAVSREACEKHEANEKFKFPKLKKVKLSELPNFRSFYPRLAKYVDDDKQSLLNQKVLMTNMEILDVCDLSNQVRIVANGMQAKFLHTLRVLRVSKCKSLEVVFDFERYTNEGKFILDQLESMGLHDLTELTHIWRMDPEGIQGFRNLRSLEVTSCCRMTYLLLPSMVTMVKNLQELKLEGCEMMEEVIERETEESSDGKMMDTMVIPQLRILQLKDLEKLQIFWFGKRDFELPLLENVFISNCPNMVSFFYPGQLVAPNLVRVKTHHHDLNEWVWKGDLNRTITYLNKRD